MITTMKAPSRIEKTNSSIKLLFIFCCDWPSFSCYDIKMQVKAEFHCDGRHHSGIMPLENWKINRNSEIQPWPAFLYRNMKKMVNHSKIWKEVFFKACYVVHVNQSVVKHIMRFCFRIEGGFGVFNIKDMTFY
jgi:hypothetical protein